MFERARKRLTQRLSLAGLGTGAGGSAKIKIPAASGAVPEPETPPTAPVEAYVDVPASVVIPHIPQTVLLDDAAALVGGPAGQGTFRLPLGLVLPMLPSGKIEFTIGDLVGFAPEGIIHPPEALGEWMAQPVLLPLPEIVMRIPPEMLLLRRDQKQIDSVVLSMNDPFSPEVLKAKAEVARAAAEASALQASLTGQPPEVPAYVPEPAAVSSVPVPPAGVPPEPVPAPPADFSPESNPTSILPHQREAVEVAHSTLDPEPEPESVEPQEPDFSFTQSPEYQALLAKLNETESAAELPGPDADMDQPSEEEAPVPGSFSFPVPPPEAETAPAPVFTQPAQEIAVPPTPPAPAPFALPSAPAALPPAERASARIPRAPLAAVPPSAVGATFASALGALSKPPAASVSPAPVSEPAPAASKPGHPGLRAALKIPETQPAEVKDAIQAIGQWPGVGFCLLSRLDGLPVTSSSAAAAATSPEASIAAVAPKLMRTLGTLFADLGRPEPDEFAVPTENGTLHFFRKGDMLMILSFTEPHLPAVYRTTVKTVLALCSSGHPAT